MPIRPGTAVDTTTTTTTTDTTTAAAHIPTNPDGRPRGPDPGLITSTLTDTRTKQPRSSSQFGANWRPILAGTRPKGGPQGQAGRSAVRDGPAALLEAPARFGRIGFQ